MVVGGGEYRHLPYAAILVLLVYFFKIEITVLKNKEQNLSVFPKLIKAKQAHIHQKIV